MKPRAKLVSWKKAALKFWGEGEGKGEGLGFSSIGIEMIDETAPQFFEEHFVCNKDIALVFSPNEAH